LNAGSYVKHGGDPAYCSSELEGSENQNKLKACNRFYREVSDNLTQQGFIVPEQRDGLLLIAGED
jgi:hypothetical protein